MVVGNVSICREHYRLTLRAEHGFPPTAPGQFVQLLCCDTNRLDPLTHPPEFDWAVGRPSVDHDRDLVERTALLRRPFSLAGRTDRPDGSTELVIIHRIVGVGTQWLAALRQGQAVSVLGPLGNRFAMPERREEHTALLIGGGVGIPPMLYLAERLGREGYRAVAFAGSVSRELLPLTISRACAASTSEPTPCIEEFARHGFPSLVSTDDGSFGYRGFITQALESYLHENSTGSFTLYTCGPEPMMKRVATIAAERGLDAQVAVERAMACGMGTCQSCCIRVRTGPGSRPPDRPDHGAWRYALACTDGPVFRGEDLLW